VSTTATVASSSHPSSPLLTPSSPATTTTTIEESDPTSSFPGPGGANGPEASHGAVTGPKAVEPRAPSSSTDSSVPSAPATPKSPPSATASTPGGGRKSWADLLRSPNSAVSSPLATNGQNAQSTSQQVARSTVSTSSPLRPGASRATLAGALAGVERQFTLFDGAEIAPRGLINNGNMCFANSILQVLVYCAPFWNLMQLLRRETKGDLSGQSKTPSMDAV
jgi:ubiquitin carboxyl-terminal hydrolase 10